MVFQERIATRSSDRYDMLSLSLIERIEQLP